jgi:pimeloyl-ACP methyl ester carboxylesterase
MVTLIPEGFQSEFTQANGVRLHHVSGGAGPPLLLVPGWPQTWAAWRHVMVVLAKEYRVIAVDFRGMGQSEKPVDGYDIGTLAADLVAMMSELGHERFLYVGHDIGTWIAFALGIDHPDVVKRMVVIDAVVPGLLDSPPLMLAPETNIKLWHFPFNQLEGLPEILIAGREREYLRWLFDHKAHKREAIAEAFEHYVEAYSAPHALSASFGWYRAIAEDVRQNEQRKQHKLSMPLLAIGGQFGLGTIMQAAFAEVTTDLQSAVIANCGHYVPEEAPNELLALVKPFFAE